MKFKRMISAIMALAVCFAMAGCDKKDSSDSTNSGTDGQGISENDSDISGTYVTLEGFRDLGNDPQKLMTDFDSAIKESHEYIASGKDEELERLQKLSLMNALSLDESGNFTAYYQPAIGSYIEFTGSYKTDGGQMSFEYKHEKLTKTMSSNGLEALDTPEVQEADAGSDELSGRQMQLLNSVGKGTYFKYASPSWYAADYLKFDMRVMPMMMGMRSIGVPLIDMQEKMLDAAKKQYFTVHNGVLCADTAGWKLEGEYKKGESFTVEFDHLAPGDDWYYYNGGDDTPEERKKILESSIRAGAEPTKIEFSSGKWEWKSADGETLNTGSYNESDEIDGLFVMYVDENSSHSAGNDIYQFVYINGSDVFFPYAVKA